MTIRTDHHERAMILAAATVAAVATWCGTVASAAAAVDKSALRVALGAFRGPESTRVRAAVEDQLLDRYVVLPEALVADSARRSGMRLNSERAFAEVGKDLKVAAFVTATVRRRGMWRVEMTVRQGDTGQALSQFDWSDSRIDKLTSRLGRSLAKRLDGLKGPRDVTRVSDDRGEPGAVPIERAPQPQPDRPVAVSAPSLPSIEERVGNQAEDDDGSPVAVAVKRIVTQDVSTPVRSYFEFRVGGRVFNRTLAYAENFSGAPGYKVSGAFAVDSELAFHPFALNASTRDSRLAAVGIIGGVTFAPSFESSGGVPGDRARTEVHGYELGTRLRTTFRAVELLPRVSYLVDSFVAQLGVQSPDVTYRTVRAGVMARFAASDTLTAFGSLDYLHVMSAGALTAENRFPRATVRGIDVTLGAGYRFMESLEVQLLTGFRRYAFDMNARPTDAIIVGGASDQYLSMTLGLAYRPLLGRN